MADGLSTTQGGAVAARSDAWSGALLAALLGLAIVFVVGFAQPEVLHNAAHDTRHAFTFPCH